MRISGLPHRSARMLAVAVLALAGVATASTASAVAPTAPSAAFSTSSSTGSSTGSRDAGEACRLSDSVEKVRRGAFRHEAPRVSQIASHTYQPGYRRYGFFALHDVDVFRTGVRFDGHLQTGVGNSYAREAERRFRVPFQRSGVVSTDGRRGVRTGVDNRTGHQVTYVFFRGAADVITAPVFVTSCRDDDGGDPDLGHLHRTGHRFVTFGHFSSGALSCDGGTRYVDEVGRVAFREECA